MGYYISRKGQDFRVGEVNDIGIEGIQRWDLSFS